MKKYFIIGNKNKEGWGLISICKNMEDAIKIYLNSPDELKKTIFIFSHGVDDIQYENQIPTDCMYPFDLNNGLIEITHDRLKLLFKSNTEERISLLIKIGLLNYIENSNIYVIHHDFYFKLIAENQKIVNFLDILKEGLINVNSCIDYIDLLKYKEPEVDEIEEKYGNYLCRT